MVCIEECWQKRMLICGQIALQCRRGPGGEERNWIRETEVQPRDAEWRKREIKTYFIVRVCDEDILHTS